MPAPTYDNTVKAARMTATRDAVADGTLEILSAADAVLAIFTLTLAGGTVSNAVWTLAFDSNSTTGEAAAGAGTTATKAQIKDSGGTARITGLSVGLTSSGSGVELDNTSIASGQTVTLSSATFTHAVDPA
jgi:hypothetical protein